MKGLNGFILTALLWMATNSPVRAQQTYQGTVYSKLGDAYKGTIGVNLDGVNGEMISITTTERTKSKGSKQTLTTTSKLNVALISHIIINDTTWYFRDIKYDYNEKYHRNTIVRLVGGDLRCGIFQTGRSNGLDRISIKLPEAELAELIDTEFDYYKVTTGWQLMHFERCVSLYDKLEKKEAGFHWDEKTSKEDRLAMWKEWIRIYTKCVNP